jgi:probable HAF family extracellular repeat protein
MRLRTLLIGPALLGLAATAHAQTYTLTDLGVPPGATSGAAVSINTAGEVLGLSFMPNGTTRTFIWRNGTYTDIGVFQNLGRTEGSTINDAGQIVGSSWASTGFPARAWLWENGTFTGLGTLGGSYANGYGLNATGQTTGWADTPSPGLYFAFVRTGATSRNLGETPLTNTTTGYAINSSGVVCGTTSLATGFARAFVGDVAGGVHDIGTLGGMQAYAFAINDSGRVVGRSDTGAIVTSGSGINRYKAHAFVWADGVMTDLDTLPGDNHSTAAAINAAGDIVGQSITDTFNILSFRCVLWRDGVATDLNTRIPQGTGWQLNTCAAINSRGQIVGRGTVAGQARAFLLTPNP